MHGVYEIEILLNDYVDREILGDSFIGNTTRVVFTICEHIEEEIGGVLCFEHVNLPGLTVSHKGKNWIMRISCCCDDHQEQLHERVLGLLR